MRGAFLSAQNEARLMAIAAGGKLGEVMTIQNPEAGAFRVGSDRLDLTATLSVDTLLGELPQILPAVKVQLAAPPVSTTARVTVEFRLGP